MKKSRAAAICAAFALSMSLLCTVAFAVEEPKEPHTPAIATTEEPTAAPDSAEAAETPESGMAAPPVGTGTVIETATEEDGREFYTITTPENNVFYLVIDRSRQTENVYFLDAVTEKDLLALAEKSGESIAETEATALEAETQPPRPAGTAGGTGSCGGTKRRPGQPDRCSCSRSSLWHRRMVFQGVPQTQGGDGNTGRIRSGQLAGAGAI